MTLDHTIRNAIGKTLAADTAAYIGLFGLPGLAGKEDVQVSQQPPAAEQQVQGSYLEQAANELFLQENAYAENSENYNCEVSIDRYWQAAEPTNDPALPEGTRIHEYGSKGICAGAHVEPVLPGELNGGHWSSSEDFKNVYFNSEYSKKVQEVFEEHGVDLRACSSTACPLKSNVPAVKSFEW